MWREVELADELGFDFAFQSIHHFHKLRPTPAVFCAGAAARTKRIRLRPMGYTAGLDYPIRLVEEAGFRTILRRELNDEQYMMVSLK